MIDVNTIDMTIVGMTVQKVKNITVKFDNSRSD